MHPIIKGYVFMPLKSVVVISVKGQLVSKGQECCMTLMNSPKNVEACLNRLWIGTL